MTADTQSTCKERSYAKNVTNEHKISGPSSNDHCHPCIHGDKVYKSHKIVQPTIFGTSIKSEMGSEGRQRLPRPDVEEKKGMC